MFYLILFMILVSFKSIHNSPVGDKISLEQSEYSNSYSENFVIKTMTSVPLYRLVEYLTNESEANEVKVKNFSIPANIFYTHMYFAWKEANQHMSSIALSNNGKHNHLIGANLVLSTSSLKDMYAPGKIASILDFAMNCYDWAKPINISPLGTYSYVSTLRAALNENINQELIKQTTKYFLVSTQPGAHHFIWENFSPKQHDFLKSLNYTKIICGNSKATSNPCDWQKLGMDILLANKQCLYRIINEGDRITKF